MIFVFLFAGTLMNKTYSRYLDSFFFIDTAFRGVLLFLLLANLSFPGSFNFVGEILALISIVQIDYFFCLWLLGSSALSCFYWFVILNRKLPYHSVFSSLTVVEFFLFFWLIILVYLSGLIWLWLDLLEKAQPK